MANTLILLRGLGRGQHHWGQFPALLAAALPDRKIVALDLAGNGDRFRETSPETITAAVADIRQQLAIRKLTPPYDVIGLSLGGMITLQWLHEHNEIDKAIIISPSNGLCPFYQRMRPLALLALATAVLLLPASTRERIIFRLTSSHRHAATTIREWTTLAQQQPVSRSNLIRQIRAAKSFDTALKIQPGKALLLASLQDRLVNVACSRLIATRFLIPLMLHPEAGHDIPLDDPDWVIEHARNHL